MNNLSATRTFEFKDGKWPDVPNGVLTLENTASCRVDVNYSLEAVKQ